MWTILAFILIFITGFICGRVIRLGVLIDPDGDNYVSHHHYSYEEEDNNCVNESCY